MDQRICIKFCVKNKIKCADAFRMLTVAYGEATLDRSNVYRWYKMFSEGREDVNDEERAGRPSTSTTDENIDEVKKIVLANRRITVREVAEDLNISIGSCHSIFTNDLGNLWKNKNWLLHHDNAPAHISLLVREFLAKNNTLMMPQPPYSPDLAPCDFFLFPKLKRPMKGRRYATIEEIKTASKEELNKITKNEFLKCFEDWKKRWHKCIISDGDYFEGDKIHIHE
ncbi:MOS1T transposase, partial [Acromyrmex heyeri]